MTLTLTINMDNAAFEDNAEYEAGRILEDLGRKLRTSHMALAAYSQGNYASLRDENGNEVGRMQVV